MLVTSFLGRFRKQLNKKRQRSMNTNLAPSKPEEKKRVVTLKAVFSFTGFSRDEKIDYLFLLVFICSICMYSGLFFLNLPCYSAMLKKIREDL